MPKNPKKNLMQQSINLKAVFLSLMLTGFLTSGAQEITIAHPFNTAKVDNGYFYNFWVRLPDTALLLSRSTQATHIITDPEAHFLQIFTASEEIIPLRSAKDVGKNEFGLVSLSTGDTVCQIQEKNSDELTTISSDGISEHYVRMMPSDNFKFFLPTARQILDDSGQHFSQIIVPTKKPTVKQLTGSYFLRDGGVDVGSSMLLLSEDTSFIIVGLGTFITGHWRISPNGSVVCTEQLGASPFIVSGTHNDKIPQGKIRIDCYGLPQAYGLIGFSSDSTQVDTLRRVFNDGANCTSSNYIITVPMGMHYLHLATPVYDRNHMALGSSVNGFLSMFSLSAAQKYNEYSIQYSERNAAASPEVFTFIYKDSSLFNNDRELGQPEELEEKESRYLSSLKTTMYAANNGGPNIDDRGWLRGQFIKPILTIRRKSYVSRKVPYFIAVCDGDK